MLESWRLHVIEAPNGNIGILLYKLHNPSFVITDIMMPELDGIELLRELFALNPQLKAIAMTGSGLERYSDPLGLAKELGVVATLEKPFRRRQLREAIDHLLAL
jgi:CheY-like chemotaxis protein